MTSSKKPPSPRILAEPDPVPTPIPGREIEEAKKKVKRKAGMGRQKNILAGKMMSQRGDVLNTTLG